MPTPAKTATLIAASLGTLACMNRVQREQTLRTLRGLRLPECTVSVTDRERIVEAVRLLLDPAGVAAGAKKRQAPVRPRYPGEQEYLKLRERFTRSSLGRQEAAEELGVSAQQVSNLVKEGHLLALEVRRSLRIPGFQFDPRQRKGYLPGLRAVRRAYGGPPLAVLEWLTARHPALEGKTPAAALAAGLVDRVVELATVGRSEV